MKLDEIFHGDSLKAADLKGKDVTLTISGWAMKDLDDGDKPEIRFAETDRTLILNKTNAWAIAEEIGKDDLNDWIGVKIVLYPTKTEFAGKRVDCIRIRSASLPEGVRSPRQKDALTEDGVPF